MRTWSRRYGANWHASAANSAPLRLAGMRSGGCRERRTSRLPLAADEPAVAGADAAARLAIDPGRPVQPREEAQSGRDPTRLVDRPARSVLERRRVHHGYALATDPSVVGQVSHPFRQALTNCRVRARHPSSRSLAAACVSLGGARSIAGGSDGPVAAGQVLRPVHPRTGHRAQGADYPPMGLERSLRYASLSTMRSPSNSNKSTPR